MKSWARDFGLACLSAVLLILAFPRIDLNILVWIGLVPLLVALEGKSLKGAFLLSSVAGFVLFAGTFYGIWSVGAIKPVHFVLLAAYFSLYWSFWGLSLTWVRRRTGFSAALIAPPLWVSLEYIRAHLSFLSLPIVLLGHSLYLHPSLIQISSITGVYGLSYLIVLMNSAIADFCLRSSKSPIPSALNLSVLKPLIIAGFLIVVTSFYGLFVLSKGNQGERITIAMIQGNIPEEKKWDRLNRREIIDRYAGLTRAAAYRVPTLTIWPETAFVGDVQHDPELQRELGQVAMDTKSFLLVGSAESTKFDLKGRRVGKRYYNSVFLITPEGKVDGEYRKLRLFPFGEYDPLRVIVMGPKAIDSKMGGVLPGEDYRLFTMGRATFGAVICWEDLFPDLFREFVKRGARFMVNPSEEDWSGNTETPYQFLAISTFRAVENRVALARSVNMGFSALIDPFGRVTERLRSPEGKDLFTEGVVTGEVTLSVEKTFYTLYGDIFASLQMAFCTIFLLHAWRKGELFNFNTTRGKQTRGETT